MSFAFSLVAEEFSSDLEAIRLLIRALNDPHTSAPKARIAAANAATLLLAATFEEFIREMARTYARVVVSTTKSFDRLPRKLAATAWRRTMETLARIRIEPNSRSASIESVFSDAFSRFNIVYEFCRGDLSKDIYSELIHNENNMRPGEINSLFGVSDLSNVCLLLSDKKPILDFFGETEIGKVHGRLLASLEEFFERRNGIAHSLNPTRSSGPEQIDRDIDMFAAFGKSLCDTLDSRAASLDGNITSTTASGIIGSLLVTNVIAPTSEQKGDSFSNKGSSVATDAVGDVKAPSAEL